MEKQTNRPRTREPFPRSSAKNAKALGSFLSVSKGVDIYMFEDPDFSANVTATVQAQGITVTECLNGFAPVPSTQPNAPTSPPMNLQVDSSNMGFFDLYDTVSWQAAVGTNSNSLCTGINSISINPYTGNCEGAASDMFNTQSYIVPANTAGNSKPISVCFGFYDASTGLSGLPSQDQLYLNLATARSTWMTDNSTQLSGLTLANVCLPGAHDAGMCTMQTVYVMLDSIPGGAFYAAVGMIATALAAACIATVFAPAVPISPAFGVAAAANAANFLCNVSITQKDSIVTMLANGIRYFDFRPGYMWWALPSLDGALYHQHLCVPGYGYVNFLTDILTFCANNSAEIVVINLCADGFIDSGLMSPSDEDLAEAWWAACNAATGPSSAAGVFNIAPAGGASALTTTFADLLSGQFNTNQNVNTDTGQSCGTAITSNQVVFLYQMPNATGPTYPTKPAAVFDFAATKDDSYSDSLYNTTDPTAIRNNFATMALATLTNNYTVLQCQGTPTLSFGVLTNAADTFSAAGSPLLAIKPAFDNCNLGWIISNTSNFKGQMLVLLNDFADNATVATAIMWNRANIHQFL